MGCELRTRPTEPLPTEPNTHTSPVLALFYALLLVLSAPSSSEFYFPFFGLSKSLQAA